MPPIGRHRVNPRLNGLLKPLNLTLAFLPLPDCEETFPHGRLLDEERLKHLSAAFSRNRHLLRKLCFDLSLLRLLVLGREIGRSGVGVDFGLA